jgi:hypothetical protein
MATTTRIADGLTRATLGHSDPRPLAGSFVTGLVAPLCCGGSLIFTSIGLGAVYSALGMWRFIPQALAAGALTMVAINYFFHRRASEQTRDASGTVRAKMFISTAIGLVMMAASFIFLEWLNHGVVHADRFLARPEFSQALIKGIPNVELLYVGATFFAVALLWALPFPGGSLPVTHNYSWVKQVARIAVFSATTALIIGVVIDASGKFGAPAGGHGASAGSHGAPTASPHGQAH